MAEALLAHVPGQPSTTHSRGVASTDSPHASPVLRTQRPNAASLSRICHVPAAASSRAQRPAENAALDAADPVHTAPKQAAHPSLLDANPGKEVAGAVRSCAPWCPTRGSAATTHARRKRCGAAAGAPPLRVYRPGAGSGVPGCCDRVGAGDDLRLQGSAALTPEDSFAAGAVVGEASAPSLHDGPSVASSMQLLRLSPQDSMTSVQERRCRGRNQGAAGCTHRVVGCDAREAGPQLVGVLQDALIHSGEGAGPRSSVKSVGGTRGPKRTACSPDITARVRLDPFCLRSFHPIS